MPAHHARPQQTPEIEQAIHVFLTLPIHTERFPSVAIIKVITLVCQMLELGTQPASMYTATRKPTKQINKSMTSSLTKIPIEYHSPYLND